MLPFTIDWLTLYQLVAGFACLLFGMAWFPCCCQQTVECTICNGDIGPAEYQVVVSGWANTANGDAASCNCQDLDATYILPFVGGCEWGRASFGPWACLQFGNHVTSVAVGFSTPFVGATTKKLTVAIGLNTPSWSESHIWEEVKTVPPDTLWDCANFNNYAPPYDRSTTNEPGGGYWCDVSGVSIAVTAL